MSFWMADSFAEPQHSCPPSHCCACLTALQKVPVCSQLSIKRCEKIPRAKRAGPAVRMSSYMHRNGCVPQQTGPAHPEPLLQSPQCSAPPCQPHYPIQSGLFPLGSVNRSSSIAWDMMAQEDYFSPLFQHSAWIPSF